MAEDSQVGASDLNPLDLNTSLSSTPCLDSKTPMAFAGPSPVSTSHSLPDRPVHVYAPTLQPDNVNLLCKYRPAMFAPQPISQSLAVNPANPQVQ